MKTSGNRLLAPFLAALIGISPQTGVAATATLNPQGPPAKAHYFAPTPSLSAVANGITIDHKSLSYRIRVAPGLPVTVPVEVAIHYVLADGRHVLPTIQTYQPKGIQFLGFDQLWNGQPRPIQFQFSFRELSGSGQHANHIRTIILDPLYDVSIGSLTFKAIQDCDAVVNFGLGHNEFNVRAWRPDRVLIEKDYALKKGEHGTMLEFRWSGREVSRSHNFSDPKVDFREKDKFPLVFEPPPVVELPSQDPRYHLIPGRSRAVSRTLTDRLGKNCRAEAIWEEKHTLKVYYSWP